MTYAEHCIIIKWDLLLPFGNYWCKVAMKINMSFGTFGMIAVERVWDLNSKDLVSNPSSPIYYLPLTLSK